MGSFPVIVPPSPGLLCALGDLVADFRNEFARTLIRLTADATTRSCATILDELEAPRARVDGRAGHRRRGASTSSSWPTCATTARATRSRCRGREGARGALQRAARAALRLPDAEHGVGDRQPARGRHRRPARARAARGASRAPASPLARPGTLRPRRPAARHTASPARRSSPSSTRPPSCCEGYVAEVDRYFNILIRPEAP